MLKYNVYMKVHLSLTHFRFTFQSELSEDYLIFFKLQMDALPVLVNDYSSVFNKIMLT